MSKKLIPTKSLEYAHTIAYNLEPIFAHYKWTYSFAAARSHIPTAHEIELNILSLMHAAMDGESAAESGRIRVVYDAENYAKTQPFEVFLGSLDKITRE